MPTCYSELTSTSWTEFQSKYWATQLSLKGPPGSIVQLSNSISNSRVDLNPYQVDAALFAVRSPLSKGVVLADEVGLGKMIEAGLVLSQRWAERRRRILIIVPATSKAMGTRARRQIPYPNDRSGIHQLQPNGQRRKDQLL